MRHRILSGVLVATLVALTAACGGGSGGGHWEEIKPGCVVWCTNTFEIAGFVFWGGCPPCPTK